MSLSDTKLWYVDKIINDKSLINITPERKFTIKFAALKGSRLVLITNSVKSLARSFTAIGVTVEKFEASSVIYERREEIEERFIDPDTAGIRDATSSPLIIDGEVAKSNPVLMEILDMIGSVVYTDSSLSKEFKDQVTGKPIVEEE